MTTFIRPILITVIFSMSFAFGAYYLKNRRYSATVATNDIMTSGRYQVRLTIRNDADVTTIMGQAGNALANNLKTNNMESELVAELALKTAVGAENLRFSHVKIVVNEQTMPSMASGMEGSQVSIKLDERGRIHEASFEENASITCVSTWVQLLGLIQSERIKDDKWQSHEIDQMGEYQVEYEAEKGSLKKTKGRIVRLNLGAFANGAEAELLPGYFWNAKFDKLGLISLNVKDGIVLTRGAQKAYRQEMHLTLSRIGNDASIPESKERFKSITFQPGLLSKWIDEGTRKTIYEQELGDTNFQDLDRQLSEGLNDRNEIDFYRKVRAFIYLYPDKVKLLEPLAIGARYDGYEMKTIPVAMGRVGSPESQASLINIIKGRLDNGMPAANLLHLLSQGSKPQPETVAFLRQLVNYKDDSVRVTATLSLGTLLGKIQQESVTAKTLSGELVGRLQAATSSDERMLYLSALSNSASSLTTDAIDGIIKNPKSEAEKIAAIKALGRINDDRAFATLRTLANATDPLVRSTAINSLADQRFDPVLWEYLQSVWRESSVVEDKAACLEWMRGHKSYIPDFRNILLSKLQNESDSALRRRMNAILEITK